MAKNPYQAARTGGNRARAILKSAGGGTGSDATPFSTAAQRKRAAGANKVASAAATAAESMQVSGSKGRKRFKRGGKVKGHTTNIAIVTPHPGAGGQPPMPPGGPMPPQPGGPPPMPMGGMGGPGMPPPGLRPGMPPQGMARGGAANMTAGAFTGVGRMQKADKRRRGG